MHRAHDYRRLLERWRAVCREAGLRLRRFASAGQHDLYYVETRSARATPAVYISTGIHGDEPAGPEALISWAEAQGRALAELPLLLFPCLNPWGLVRNLRVSEDGLDLNRVFQRSELPFVSGWQSVMKDRRFTAALTLHEDYDGEGLYLYEIQHRPPGWGELLLRSAHAFIPSDERPRMDRFLAEEGVIRRRPRMSRFLEIGFPEALWLHLHYADRTFTVEAPSEFALEKRAGALRAVIGETIRLSLVTSPSIPKTTTKAAR